MAAQFFRGLNPFFDNHFYIGNRFLIRFSISHATRQLGYLRNKGTILIAPVDDNFVIIRHLTPPAYIVL